MMTPVDAQSTDDVGVYVHTFMHRRSNFNQTRQARGAVSVSPSRAVNPKPSIARVNALRVRWASHSPEKSL